MDMKRCDCWPAEHTTVGRQSGGRVRLQRESSANFPQCGQCVGRGNWQGSAGRHYSRRRQKHKPKCSFSSENSQASLSGQFILPSNEDTVQSGSWERESFLSSLLSTGRQQGRLGQSAWCTSLETWLWAPEPASVIPALYTVRQPVEIGESARGCQAS